jgi:hypothetical protein
MSRLNAPISNIMYAQWLAVPGRNPGGDHDPGKAYRHLLGRPSRASSWIRWQQTIGCHSELFQGFDR